MRRTLVAAALTVAVALPAWAGETRWVEVKSPHFTVISSAGEKTGRRVAWQFEQVRAVLQQVWPWAQAPPNRPVVVFAVSDEATLKSLAPEYWEGKRYRPGSVWVTGSDKHYIAMRTDLGSERPNTNPHFDAYLAYIHNVLSATFPPSTPIWFKRGLAEVMANTVVRDKTVDIGLPVPWHLERLQGSGRLTLPEMLAVKSGSPYLTRGTDRQRFDAQCWAFAHYLMFGEKGTLQPRFNRLAQLLRDGHDPDASFREALGDPKPYEEALAGYINRRVMQYSSVDLDVNITEAGFNSRALTPAAAAAARAGFHVAMRRPVEARALADEARKGEPKLPGPWEVDGLLLDGENKREEAKAAFAKAAELGSENAYVHYRLAQLLSSPNPTAEQRQAAAASLEKALQVAPDYANALSYLALVRGELGTAEEGLKLANRAVELEPTGSYHRLAQAHALARLQRIPEAAAAARTALVLADADWERQNAKQFLDFLASLPPK